MLGLEVPESITHFHSLEQSIMDISGSIKTVLPEHHRQERHLQTLIIVLSLICLSTICPGSNFNIDCNE